jgi:flagellar motor component MotA
MFVIIGIVIVIGAILGGYLMEHGNIPALLQPAELVIIGAGRVAASARPVRDSGSTPAPRNSGARRSIQ